MLGHRCTSLPKASAHGSPSKKIDEQRRGTRPKTTQAGRLAGGHAAFWFLRSWMRLCLSLLLARVRRSRKVLASKAENASIDCYVSPMQYSVFRVIPKSAIDEICDMFPPTQNTRLFQGIFGSTWLFMVNTSFFSRGLT